MRMVASLVLQGQDAKAWRCVPDYLLQVASSNSLFAAT
jgi:hypothetical protein